MAPDNSKLERLGDILGVDDTEEVERPEPRRGVGEVLSGRAPRPDAANDQPSVSPSPPATASTKKPAPARSMPRPAPAEPVSVPPRPLPRDGVPKQRTSSTLPVELSTRLGEARGRRWSINRVISSAVAQPALPVERAEELLERYEGSPRAVCSYRVPVAEVAALDEVAHRWRMSRSEVLTVLLDVELERLGF